MPRPNLPLLLSLATCSLSLLGCATGGGGSSTPAVPDATAMLERSLPAVVTVAVETDQRQADAFGFGGGDESARAAAAAAYARALDLSPYVGSGSGFVVEREGRKYVVTNSHVIDMAGDGRIDVFSVTRERYPMRLVGADSYRDVAVLEFTGSPGPEVGTVRIHEENDLRIGTPVYAVGNPLGEFPYSVTSGIISGLNRTLDGFAAREGYLQTDATLIWGNSGGPLIGPAGDVVGLNSRIHLLRQLGGVPAPQINFSLAGPHLARIVDELIEHGRVQRPYLGLVLMGTAGAGSGNVAVNTVLDDTPAAGALGDQREGDAIRSINGEPVASLEEVAAVFENVRPGQSVTLEFADGGTASIPTERLSSQRMEELGQRLLASLFGTRATEDAGGLYVTSGPSGRPARVRILGDGTTLPKPGDRVTLGGFIGEDSQVWRVNSLHDLAVTARLVLASGSFGFVYEDGDEMRAAVVDLPPLGIF